MKDVFQQIADAKNRHQLGLVIISIESDMPDWLDEDGMDEVRAAYTKCWKELGCPDVQDEQD